MSSDLTTYVGNAICRWLAGQAMPTPPTLYVALYDGDPKTTGTEISVDVDPSGGRQEFLCTAPAVGVVNTLTNDFDADFGNAANAVSLSHVALFDDPTAGNMISTKALSGGPFAVTVNQQVLFAAGDLEFIIGS